MSTPITIPKARQLFRGDINDAVIRVQQKTGIEINKAWWDKNVGNGGSTEQILERFDKAYPVFVAGASVEGTVEVLRIVPV